MSRSKSISRVITSIKGQDWIASGLLFVFLGGSFYWAWAQFNAEVHRERIERVRLMGQFAEEQVVTVVNENIDVLDNLRRRLEITDGSYFQFWEHDAERLLAQNPTFQVIEWIDSGMVVREVLPEKGNESALGLDIGALDYRRKGWLKSTRSGRINFTPWLKLTQGGEAFLVDAPVYVNDRLWGTLTAGMDFTKHVNNIFDERIGYHFHLHDHKDLLFYCSDPLKCRPIEVDKSLVYTASLPVIDNVNWEMQLFPTELFFDQGAEDSNLIGLVLSLGLSLTMAVLLFFLINYSRDRKLVRKANEELTELNRFLSLERQRAEKASAAKTEFLANMSHEIRTPLNGILGLISILRNEGDLSNEQKRNLQLMETSSKNLHGLLNNVLEIERIESGSIDLNMEVFSPEDRLKALIEMFDRDFRDSGIEFKYDFGATGNRAVRGDAVKFIQVITNLLRNAFKFTEHGFVKVTYEERLQATRLVVKIKVQDSGIGIPKEDLEHIFDRFSQMEPVYNKKHEGSGLGLTISKHLVDLMQGSIHVTSEMGVGSTFEVEIPFERVMDRHEEEELDVSETDFSDLELLIVEDNELNRLVMQKMLVHYGLYFECAENGLEAVDKVRSKQYDLILMDLHMPEMDGFNATKKIRDMGIKTPIIAVSANVTAEAIKAANDAGMEDYISKPFSRSQLEELLLHYWKQSRIKAAKKIETNGD